MKKRITALIITAVTLLTLLSVPFGGAFAAGGGAYPASASTAVSAAATARTVVHGAGVTRYTVLVLDVSGSMAGEPIKALRTAAKRFCEQVFQDAVSTNYVALVTYSTYTYVNCGFTNDLDTLIYAADALYQSGTTNTEGGLRLADALLAEIPDDPKTVKNIILMSDGMPNEGAYINSGPYSLYDYFYNTHANAAFSTAEEIKGKGTYIYTLGFFHSLSGSELTFGRRFLSDLQNAGYYEVTDPSDLEFTFGDLAGYIVNPDVCGTFEYSGVGGMQKEEFLYYDDMFSHPASKYDHDLATMSLQLAMAAFGMKRTEVGGKNKYSDDSEQAENIIRLLVSPVNADEPGLGFSDVRAVNYQNEPDIDSIAVTFGHKEIISEGEPYELIVIAIRGGEYRKEWAGNFKIGSGDIHEGFEKAKNQVVSYFASYIDEFSLQGKQNVKLWVTGYSRAAATANLFAAEMDNHTSGSPFTIGETANSYLTSSKLKAPLQTSWKTGKLDIYAYCFATPNNSKKQINGRAMQSSSKESEYPNIFNILNPNDVVPRVAPYSWGYDKYGYSYWIPAQGSANNGYNYKAVLEPAMKNELAKLSGSFEYLIDKFRVHKGNSSVAPPAVWDVGPHPTNNPTMNQYIDGRISTMLFKDLIKDQNAYTKKIQDKAVNAIAAECDKAIKDGKEDKFNPIGALIGVILEDTLKAATKVLFSGENNDCAVTLQPDNGDTVRTRQQDFEGKDITLGESQAEVKQNAEAIAQGHFPELYLAWMRSLPDDYFGGIARRNPVNYRVIHINCPVNIEVYDKSGALLGIIEDDVPAEMTGSGVSLVFDEDGSKTVYLPADEDYNIRITATDAGTMSYSISEYNRETGGSTRLVNYYDIPLEKGDIFESFVSAVGDPDEKTVYELYDSEGIILPDEDFDGEDLPLYYIEIEVQGDGSAAGGGVYYSGEYTQCLAYPDADADFLGWYSGGKLASADAVYRHSVRADDILVARFTTGNDSAQTQTTIPPAPPPDSPAPPATPGGDDGGAISPGGGSPAMPLMIVLLIAAGLFTGVIVFNRKGKPPHSSYTQERGAHSDQAVRGMYAEHETSASREEAQAHEILPARPPLSGLIRVLTGALAGTSAEVQEGRSIRLEKSLLADLVFPGEYIHVSRDHCTISYDPANRIYTVTDESSNGTYTDSFRLPGGTQAPLPANTVLKLADDGCLILLV